MSEKAQQRRTTDEWTALIEAYLDSGLTQNAFCQQHGISMHTFSHRYQSSPLFRGRRRRKREADFKEIAVPAAKSSSTDGWIMHYDQRVRIECPADLSVDTIVQLARGLAHDA